MKRAAGTAGAAEFVAQRRVGAFAESHGEAPPVVVLALGFDERRGIVLQQRRERHAEEAA